jgi:UDP-N-acetylglucosamine transferase subunit ALG13
MLFVTVGTDQPFDRLVKVVDAWARANNRRDVFAQIGVGGWRPEFIPYAEFLDPVEFKQRFASADCILGHAGMGTILSALHQGKPILVMPKRASLGEHRNEHQLATARRFQEVAGVQVAFDEAELVTKLDKLGGFGQPTKISSHASESLITALRAFIGEEVRK